MGNILRDNFQKTEEIKQHLAQKLEPWDCAGLLEKSTTPSWLLNCIMESKFMPNQWGTITDHLSYLKIDYLYAPEDTNTWRSNLDLQSVTSMKAVTTIGLRNKSLFSLAHTLDEFLRFQFLIPLYEAYKEQFGNVPGAFWPDKSSDLAKATKQWNRNDKNYNFISWQAIIMSSGVTEFYRHPKDQEYLHATVEVWIDVYKTTNTPPEKYPFRLPDNYFEKRLYPERFEQTEVPNSPMDTETEKVLENTQICEKSIDAETIGLLLEYSKEQDLETGFNILLQKEKPKESNTFLVDCTKLNPEAANLRLIEY